MRGGDDDAVIDPMGQVFQQMQRGVELGVLQVHAEDYTGRHLRIEGRDYLNFTSCSYLGLECDARLKRGAIDAIERWGIQMSCSRTFVSAPPYRAVEALTERLFGGPTVVCATTTLAHQSALPALVRPGDVVLFDRNVHASVQATLPYLATVGGATVERVRHNDLADLEARLATYADGSPRRVHFLTDGVFSIHGEGCDIAGLRALVDRHPALHLYIDDAHGVSWHGPHGRGWALADGAIPRATVVGSFAKSFGAGGGVVVCPSREAQARIRACGPSLIFSGPIQTPVLGAMVASLELHLSDAHAGMQAELRARMNRFDEVARALDLPVSHSDSPIRFIVVGEESDSYRATREILDAGFYITPMGTPAVRAGRTGLRFTLTRHQRLEDIDALLETVARALGRVEGRVREAV